MCSNGLNWSDIGNVAVVGGLAADFFRRIGIHYGESRPVYIFESHVAAAVFSSYIREGHIAYHVYDVVAVQKDQHQQITKLLLTNGDTITGDIFIDASYEGDLMDLAGVKYRFGRESQAEYDEPLAGYNQYPIILPASAYTGRGRPATGRVADARSAGWRRGQDGSGLWVSLDLDRRARQPGPVSPATRL